MGTISAAVAGAFGSMTVEKRGQQQMTLLMIVLPGRLTFQSPSRAKSVLPNVF